ncbi:hypothetical protein MMC09_006178 [Bachmanniomyces sp. S44760]|nr:hypothetical protein [Bachmanniomyces sp. S44760]
MDPDIQSKFAIHEAAREGRTNIVESLLNANPRLAVLRDQDDRLPVHWAASNNHVAIVEIFISQKGFDPDVQDGSGWTLLHIASSLSDGEELVGKLLRKEVDINMKSLFAAFITIAYHNDDHLADPYKISTDRFEKR